MAYYFQWIWNWVHSHPYLILGGFLVYVILFLLSLLLSSPKAGPNAFDTDTRKEARPVELNASKRDAVLKQGFHLKRVPDKLDAIVVGSGIGGLAVANILARLGKRVLVLEQHDQAGGCLHTFVEKGFEFDVGVHYIGNMNTDSTTKTLMDQLTEGQLKWQNLDDAFDVILIGKLGEAKRYPMASGKKEWTENLIRMFPEDAGVIKKFVALLTEVRHSILGMALLKMKNKMLGRLLISTGLFGFISKYLKFASMTMEQALDNLTDNTTLKAVLAYPYGDVGNTPDKLSFTLGATVMSHYYHGASYPIGGASEMTMQLIPTIERAGGKVLVRAPVSEILISEGRAYGVRIQKTSGPVDIYAPLIISDAGVINTFTKLIPKEIAIKTDLYKIIENKSVKSGQAALNLFVGLKGTSEELGLKAQNYWCFPSAELSKDMSTFLGKSVDEAMEAETTNPVLFVSFPSTKDPTFQKKYPGNSVCTVVTFAKHEWFEEWEDRRVLKRGEDYEAIKMAFGRLAWEQVLMEFPQLRDKVEYFSVGSPLSNTFYLGAPKGEIYGLDTDVARFSDSEAVINLRPKTDIPGLLLTGQDVFCPGVSGALMGGVLCASQILSRNVLSDVNQLRQRINKSE